MENMKYYCDNKRHLICVPYSVENLHKMAKDLKIGAWWFHNGKLPHYDIPLLRIKEITAKCTVISPKDIVGIITMAIIEEKNKIN